MTYNYHDISFINVGSKLFKDYESRNLLERQRNYNKINKNTTK